MQSNSLKGLEFFIKNLTSSMFLGIESPIVSGRKRMTTAVEMVRRKLSS